MAKSKGKGKGKQQANFLLGADVLKEAQRNNNRGFNKGGGYGFGSNFGGGRANPPADAKPKENATAPYNFVPLASGILPSPLDEYFSLAEGKNAKEKLREAMREFISAEGKLSGEIDLTLTLRTPLFIGGAGEESFAPNGEPIIPGSTLRGMVKNLVKIAACGALRPGEDFIDRHIYYRSLMAPMKAAYNKNLHENYMQHMVDEKTNRKKALPGFLVRKGSEYLVYPMIDNKPQKITIVEFQDEHGRVRDSKVVWDGTRAYCVTGGVLGVTREPNPAHMRRGTLLDESDIKVFLTKCGTNKKERCKLGKQYIRFMDTRNIDKSRVYVVPDTVIDEYVHDNNRRGVDLLVFNEKNPDVFKDQEFKDVCPTLKEKVDSIVPCFYFLDRNNQVKTFGHGQSFRIAYDRSVGDAVPDKLKGEKIDFADALFGRSTKDFSWAGRLSFMDATSQRAVKMNAKGKAHALMQPNPTAYQLYLTQEKTDKELRFWDVKGSTVRGYKLYWHQKNGFDWHATPDELKVDAANPNKILSTIQPLSAGNVFKGKIRFERLSTVELGALMRVLHLEESEKNDIVYKLGHGKSIGLGSVNIDSVLKLEENPYAQIFAKDGWHDALKVVKPAEYIKAFEEYANKQGMSDLCNTAANSLRDMLDYNNVKHAHWLEATSAMGSPTTNKAEGDKPSFAGRSILLKIEDVIKKAQKG